MSEDDLGVRIRADADPAVRSLARFVFILLKNQILRLRRDLCTILRTVGRYWAPETLRELRSLIHGAAGEIDKYLETDSSENDTNIHKGDDEDAKRKG